VDFQLNYRLKNKIDEFSADDQTKYNAQSTNKLQEIWAEKPKS